MHHAAVDFDAGIVNSFVSPAIQDAVVQHASDNQTKAASTPSGISRVN